LVIAANHDYFLNRPTLHSLPSSVYGLSNVELYTPWPKTVALKKSNVGGIA